MVSSTSTIDSRNYSGKIVDVATKNKVMGEKKLKLAPHREAESLADVSNEVREEE